MLSALTPDEQRLKDWDFKWGKRSTFYLGKRILGYDFYEKPHRGICNFIDKSEEYKTALLLDPRGCFKTSIISQAYPVRRIIENHNIRILLCSVSLTNSQDNLKVVRGYFESHEKLRELYGDFYSKDRAWNDSEFVVRLRTDARLKDPTVKAAGIGTSLTGKHYDLIICDDLHDEENYKSVEQVKKIKDYIRLVFGLLNPGGEFIVGGHRWSYTDAYSMMLGETNKPEEVEFSELFCGHIYKHGAINPDGTFYFPDWGPRQTPPMSTHDFMKRQRVGLGRENYAAMMMNEPVLAGDGQKFEQRYFKRHQEPLQAKDEKTGNLYPKLHWYLTIDPGGKKKGNDNWVIFEGAMDSLGNQYFTRYIQKLSKTSQAAEDVYRWWLQKKAEGAPYKAIGFECCGQQEHMLDHMKEYLWDKYKVQLPFVKLNHSDDSKEMRIEGMGPKYENGKIFHSAQMGESFGLEDQLIKFPKGVDDVADAASMQEEVAVAPKIITPPPMPKTQDEMLLRTEERRLGAGIQRVHHILGSD